MGRLIYLVRSLMFRDKEVICKMSHNNTIRVKVEIGFNRINFLKFAKISEYKNGKIYIQYKMLKNCLKSMCYK